MHRKRRGATIIEAIVGIACAAAIIGAAAMLADGQQRSAQSVRDGTQQIGIHQAMVTFANASGGRFPTPGLIRRLPTDLGAGGPPRRIPGEGDEDITMNTTANLYSVMIAQAYFNPDIVVSPIEPNPNVKVMQDYNYDRYNPTEATYWDEAFKADLAECSHASYAHLVMFGDRKKLRWRDSLSERDVHLSSRGPEDGMPNADSRWCDPHGSWSGNVVTGDNRVIFVRTTAPDEFPIEVEDARQGDNLFAFDDGHDGRDLILTFTQSIDGERGPTVQFD